MSEFIRYDDTLKACPEWRAEYMADKTCGGCGRASEGDTDRLVFDHCHEHGFVRAVVCGSCNYRLGQIDSLVRAGIVAEYVHPWPNILDGCPDCAGVDPAEVAVFVPPRGRKPIKVDRPDMTREQMRAHAEAAVADWPPPTREQLDRLAAIFRSARRAA